MTNPKTSLNGPLFKLHSKFQPFGDQPQAIKEILAGFREEGKTKQVLLGVTGSGKTFTTANVIVELGLPTLVLAPNKTLAAQLFSEFREFFPQNAVEYFVSYYDFYRPEAYIASSDTYVEKDAQINDEIDKLRHSTTRSLVERRDVIVVASVSCIYGIGDPEEYKEHRIVLCTGDQMDRDHLIRELVRIQFQRNDFDATRGTFRVRGDMVEIFPAYEATDVIRVEFFGDEIVSITQMDPLKNTLIRKMPSTVIYPTSHYVVGEERLKEAMKTIREELRDHLGVLKDAGKVLEYARLEQRTQNDLEMMEQIGFCSGIENYSRHFTQKAAGSPPPTLIDFFGKEFLLVIDESHLSIPQVGGMFKGDYSRKKNLVDFGFRLPSALDNRPLNFEEFESKYSKVLFVSATPGPYELKSTAGEFVEQIIRPTGLIDPVIEVRPADNQVADLFEEIKKIKVAGFRALVTTLTKKLAEELTKYFQGMGIKVSYLHSDITTLDRLSILQDLRKGVVDVVIGINLLREGLDLPEVALVAICDADKEGFLRSAPSLIQTIGRAARNSEGRVIMYAYKMTASMEKAIEETKRRRKIQKDFNDKFDITPQTIIKEISGGVMEALWGSDREVNGESGKSSKNKKGSTLNNKKDQFLKRLKKGEVSLWEMTEEIQSLRKAMNKAAKKMEFEKAAEMRDEIKKLNEMLPFLS